MSLPRRRYLRTVACATVAVGAGCQALQPGDEADDGSTGDDGSPGRVDRPEPTEADPEVLESEARSFVESLAAGEYERAHGQFAPSFQDTISPGNLEGIWERVVEENGPYGSIADVRHESSEARDIVVVVAEFESGRQPFRFTFLDGTLTGLSLPDESEGDA